MKTTSKLYAALMFAITYPLVSVAAEDNAKGGTSTEMIASSSMSSGEVKKIDKDAGKVSIKHGPLKNLEMPAMTMVFRVKDAAMLDQFKPGDQINFLAEKVNGSLTVTKIESAK
jgi:Cu/Ag efflux protein CusF